MSAQTDRPSGAKTYAAHALAWAIVLLLAAGCSRAHYRRQADQEVYGLVDRASRDPRWPLQRFTIEPDPRSRMFDPFCRDLPPMPPDDPTSHRLMHCVDCKPGWPCWRCYGKTPWVENPDWKACLPYNEKGQLVLDRGTAMEVALLHSRAYQRELEDLYLAALGVTFERFRLDAQFFGGNSTFFTADGPSFGDSGPIPPVDPNRNNAQSLLTTDNANNRLRMRKVFASGGELVVGMANSLVWQFAGPDEYGANTLLDFSLVQPLLRAAGRAVVLEELTNSERLLLANIRDLERFRRRFHTGLVVGRGGIGLTEFQLFGSRRFEGRVEAPANGFLGLLEQDVRIRNQRANVARLRESLERMEAFYEVGRVSSQQVGITRQGLYDAQSDLLTINAEYQTQVDGYKIALGLPPDLDVQIEDSLLATFNLIDPELTATQDAANELMSRLRDVLDPDREAGNAAQEEPKLQQYKLQQYKLQQYDYLGALTSIRKETVAIMEMVDRDLKKLTEGLPPRRKSLQQLATRGEFDRGEIDPSVVSIEALEQRAVALEKLLYAPPEGAPEKPSLAERMNETLTTLGRLQQAAAEEDRDQATLGKTSAGELLDWVSRLSGELIELSLIQAKARLDTATLEPIEIEPRQALEIARENRRDWMNARAALVDVWRQIEVTANDLQSGLDVTFSGDLNTTDNNPVRFRGTTSRLRVGLAFDAPLTRLEERNTYRTALINYQRARRGYYALEDGINENLRNIIRTIRLNQLNFEVQRASVLVAAARVDETQERLAEPGGSKLAVNTARDLVEALQALLRAQNDFLRIWVNQEALRMNLDLNLGTMELDPRGMWIDPGPIGQKQAPEAGVADEAPLPEEIPLPVEETPPMPAISPLL